MNWCTYDEKGKILSCGASPYELTVADLAHREGFPLLDIPVGISSQSHYYQDGKFIMFPKCPGQFHDWNWESKQWELNLTKMGNVVRQQRNALLTACDWTQLPDVPVETKTGWAEYRQLLRDITEQSGFPESVIWPNKPE